MMETNLPVLYLKDKVLLPFNEVKLDIVGDKEKQIINISMTSYNSYILIVNLKDPLEENPLIDELPKIAIVGHIKSKLELPNGCMRIILSGIERVNVNRYLTNTTNTLFSFVSSIDELSYDRESIVALKRVLYRKLDNYIDISSYMSNTVLGRIADLKDINKIIDIIISELPFEYKELLKYIYLVNPLERIKVLIEDLNEEIETVKLENEIEDNLKNKLEADQKEYMLREKLRLIKEELGETDIKEEDVLKIREKMASIDLPANIEKKLNDELERYILTSNMSPEVNMIRTYIDWLISLPWNSFSEDNKDINEIEKVLNVSHFGLDSVKKRIIEYIAVKKKTNTSNSPIICLVGPPGVGKTTLARSIAKALNREFVSISLGGVSDESEILGHRRTYVGSSPGKIIQKMKKCKTCNPVFLIDEVDKLTKNYKGDPASALLEILDKEQNSKFCDNYLEEEYDLSNVMFILTANNLSLVPTPLLDRFEIIELSSYTVFEKINIAKEHLIPTMLDEYKIKNIFFEDKAIEKIIVSYTKEAGARDLRRLLDSIIRKIIINNNKNQKIIVDERDIEFYLGPTKYNLICNDENNKTGIVNGLAYTPYGGNILKVTCTIYPGKGNIRLTGTLGDVIKESIYIALSYIKANNEMFKIDFKLFEESDFHFHIEEGGILKDGPSAGITIVTAILSLLKNKIISNKISMTGEITLRGKILPVGGLKEKLISASTSGIDTVYLPLEASKELASFPDEVKNTLNIIFASDYEEIYNDLFK